jgi:hypothetical protein
MALPLSSMRRMVAAMPVVTDVAQNNTNYAMARDAPSG